MEISRRTLTLASIAAAVLLLLLTNRQPPHTKSTTHRTARTVRTITAHGSSPEELAKALEQAHKALQHGQKLTFADVPHGRRV